MNIPLGFDIIVMSILEPFADPWPMLSEAMDSIYKRITLAHGSPPTMDTIVRKLDWWDGNDELGIVLTWDAPEFDTDTIPMGAVIAIITGRVAA